MEIKVSIYKREAERLFKKHYSNKIKPVRLAVEIACRDSIITCNYIKDALKANSASYKSMIELCEMWDLIIAELRVMNSHNPTPPHQIKE